MRQPHRHVRHPGEFGCCWNMEPTPTLQRRGGTRRSISRRARAPRPYLISVSIPDPENIVASPPFSPREALIVTELTAVIRHKLQRVGTLVERIK